MQTAQEAGDAAGKARLGPPGRRRALGELTNTPLLLSPGALVAPETAASTPPKAVGGTGRGAATTPDTVTPTHNLKLLTELASKMAGAGSTARQTLQFEDSCGGEGGRYPAPILLPSSHQAEESASPHRDHPYPARGGVAAPARPGPAPRSKPVTPTGPADVFPRPGPATAAPAEKGANRKEKSLGLLAERLLASLPASVESGRQVEIQLDDTARALQTERRRIYDIVNVFEAVQIMSKVMDRVDPSYKLTLIFRWVRMFTNGTGGRSWCKAWPGCGSSPCGWGWKSSTARPGSRRYR